MCGRFAFFSPAEAVAGLFGVEFPFALRPRYNIAPGSVIVTLRAGPRGSPEPALLRWGLVPSWAKDAAIGNRLSNARVETAHQKPSFRAAFKRRRCVILADGFYEWRVRADGKVPYFIARGDGRPMAMAGLWEHWAGPGGEPLETCTILTTAANELIAPLHARMPVVLAPPAVGRWLGPEADAAPVAHAALRAADNDRLAFRPVSRAVNDPRHDGPALIEPDPAAGAGE